MFNQFNNLSKTHDFKDSENVVKCKYYTLDEAQTMKNPNKKSCLPLFQISTCSLTKTFEDLEYLLKTSNTNFDIIAISETLLLKNNNIGKNINVPNFSYEFSPTESTAGGTSLDIANHLAYQRRNDLNLYRKKYLESTFIEITNLTKTNIIVD